MSAALTPAQLRERAERWFEREMAIAERAHGARWPEHRDWVADYLRQEIRERLQDLERRPPARRGAT